MSCFDLPLILLQTYAFALDASVTTDPLYISSFAQGLGADEVGLPVVQNSRATAGQTLFITPDDGTPPQLWFESTTRNGAGQILNIVNPPSSQADLSSGSVLAFDAARNATAPCHLPFQFNGTVIEACHCGGLMEVPWCSLAADAQAGAIGACVAGSPVDASCTADVTVPAVKPSPTTGAGAASDLSPAGTAAVVVVAAVGFIVLVGVFLFKRHRLQARFVSSHNYDAMLSVFSVHLRQDGTISATHTDVPFSGVASGLHVRSAFTDTALSTASAQPVKLIAVSAFGEVVDDEDETVLARSHSYA